MIKVFFIVIMGCFFLTHGVSQAREIPLTDLKFEGDKLTRLDDEVHVLGHDPGFIIKVDSRADKNNLLTIEYKRKKLINKADIVFIKGTLEKGGRYRKKVLWPAQTEYGTITINLDSNKNYTGHIDYIAVLFEGEDEDLAIKRVSLEGITLKNYFKALWLEVFEYKHFKPPNINYVMVPTVHGRWLNEPLTLFLVSIILLSLFIYFFTDQVEFKRKVIRFNFVLLILSWLLSDGIQTVNQVRLYQEMTAKSDILENARTAGIFTEYLKFVKEHVPQDSQVIFLAPYPYYFEGKYHMYPYYTFGKRADVDYVLLYNRPNNFGFKFAKFDSDEGVLRHVTGDFKIKQMWQFNKMMFVFEVQR